MQDAANILDQDLSGLSARDWEDGLAKLASKHGMYHALDAKHFATFVDQDDTLLVSFESLGGIRALSPKSLPIGFDLARTQGWSHLCLLSKGDTWFRSDSVYDLFDQLIDDEFFDQFEKVVFYGAGPCAYAAAAFSIAAPGASVVLIQPQATLDPRLTSWDERFVEMRHLNFNDRYGYAPDMLETAGQSYVIYDPHEHLDAMHATLFRGPNTQLLPTPYMGAAIQTRLMDMKTLYRILSLAGSKRLTRSAYYKLMRARRDHRGYLRDILAVLERQNRTELARLLCENVCDRINAPHFHQRLDALKEQLDGDA